MRGQRHSGAGERRRKDESAGRVIRARVYGGLGNQCFIYAAGRALADRVGGELVLDVSPFQADATYRRRLVLKEFGIRAGLCGEGRSRWRATLGQMSGRFRGSVPWLGRRWLVERVPRKFQPEVALWRGISTTLDGYWQSERYFADCRAAIAADLVVREARALESMPIVRRIRGCEHAVFVHVRSYREVPGREDGSFSLPQRYYCHAVARVRSLLPQAEVFVFSDDPAWARERLGSALGAHCSLVGREAGESFVGGPLVDFHLMTLCRHAIVANSTFSWWAAWLGEQRRTLAGQGGVIMRPAAVPTNEDYYPARWESVGCS